MRMGKNERFSDLVYPREQIFLTSQYKVFNTCCKIRQHFIPLGSFGLHVVLITWDMGRDMGQSFVD